MLRMYERCGKHTDIFLSNANTKVGKIDADFCLKANHS